MYSIDAEEWPDWQEMMQHHLENLPPGWVLWTRVHIKADPNLAKYLKSSREYFETAARTPQNWVIGVVATDEGIDKIEKHGWEPSRVDVIVRWVGAGEVAS